MGGKPRSSGKSHGANAATVIDEPVAMVIVNYRTPDLTKACLSALRRERRAFRNFRVLLVDGGSGDGSVDQLAAFIERGEFRDWVDLLALPINGGFGWSNNEAICRLTIARHPPKFIHLLNPDAEVEAGAVLSLWRFLEDHPDFAAAGSQLINVDGSLAGSGFRFTDLLDEISRGARTRAVDRLLRRPPLVISAQTVTEVDWTTGASVMFRVEALRQVGLFDEGFFLYHEEVELMWRLNRAGWRIALDPGSRVRHVGGAATGMGGPGNCEAMEPRRPTYWFRSRSRYFALSRGRLFAVLAFFAWQLGYLVWLTRRIFGFAPDAKPIDHLFRDHFANAFPTKRDAIAAVRNCKGKLGCPPAWMQERPS